MPDNDSSGRSAGSSGDLWLGVMLLVAAATVVVLAIPIRSIGFAENSDPGPRAFPFGLAILLAAGGLFEVFRGWRRAGVNEVKTSGDQDVEAGPLPRQKPFTVLLLLGAILAYVVLLPILGFTLSTVLMAPAMMVVLGNSIRFAVTVSIILVCAVVLMFVTLFKVPLPGGFLGLPF